MRPTNAPNGQREWVQHISGTGYTRATRAKVYDNLLKATPYRWNLTTYKPNERGGYLIGTAADNPPENLNPEQEELI